MKPLFFFFFIFLFIGIVSATGFSPSSLIYNLEQGKEDCKIVSVSSDSEIISVSDKWADNVDVEWKVSNFNSSADEHGLFLNYDDELNESERQVEVCLSGSEVGEYHGVLLLREGQEGNSIVQMGIWLKVTITEPPQNNQPPQENSGGSSNNGGSVKTTTIKNKTKEVKEINETSGEDKGETGVGDRKTEAEQGITKAGDGESKVGRGITGAVIGFTKTGKSILGFVAVLLITAGIVYGYRKRKENIYE